MDQLQEVLQMCVHISTRLNGPSGVNQETLDCQKKGFQTIFQPEKLNVWHSTKMNKIVRQLCCLDWPERDIWHFYKTP